MTAKLLFIFGLTNLVFLLAVFFSCRCLAGPKIIASLFRYTWFKQFYRHHCYYWYAFFASVIAHTLLALSLFGNPF